jgi:rod shape-determining protein MreC
MLRKKHYLAFGAVALAAVLILSLPTQVTSHLKLALSSLFLPLLGLTHTVRQLPAAAAEAVLPRGELLKELEQLRRENEQLKIQLQQAAALARENDLLRAQIGWQRQMPWKLKLARVILRDPANWWHTVQIDLGKRDGLRENLPVLTPEGLVGRTAAVGDSRAQVILVDDPNCRVSACVLNPARDVGILAPGGPLDDSLVNLTYLAGDANLKPGQEVVTSGQGGIFPAGIPIGQIVDSRQVEYGLYTEARVKLAANLGALDEVWVLLP